MDKNVRKAQELQEQHEHEEAERRTSPSGKIVYNAVLKEGTDELARPSSALFWSGIAAGLSMGFSLIAAGLLRANLPPGPAQILVGSFGYCVGFLIVILGRQQLFTENTLTPILPLLQNKNLATLLNVLRLWGIVFVANLIGGVAVAWFAFSSSVYDQDVRRMFIEIGRAAMVDHWGTIVLRGIFAGWLVALLVWLLPFAETARIWVIIILTYIIALANLSHCVAGSIEVFVLALAGEQSWGAVLGSYVVPATLGNIVGGVTLVAAINHAQVTAGEKGTDL